MSIFSLVNDRPTDDFLWNHLGPLLKASAVAAHEDRNIAVVGFAGRLVDAELFIYSAFHYV